MKLNTKTIVLTGTEQEIRLSGQNCDIRNDGTDTVYASGEAGIVAGADGVMSLPAGQAVQIRDFGGVMYLLGTGSVQICGHDYQTPVFKCAPTGGGDGTVDQTARDTINLHANNTDIHLTAEDVASLVSNENLLINGDFRNAINQRGQSEYTDGENAVFSIDGWRSAAGFKVTVDDGIIIEPVSVRTDNTAGIVQVMEAERFYGRTLTFSADVEDTNDYAYMLVYATTENGTYVRQSPKIKLEKGINSTTIKNIPETAKKLWAQFTINAGADVGDVLKLNRAKLELGEHATPFVPPNAATELLKCQRYYQLRSTGDIDPIDLRPVMREITDIRQREDGNYEYIAEL